MNMDDKAAKELIENYEALREWCLKALIRIAGGDSTSSVRAIEYLLAMPVISIVRESQEDLVDDAKDYLESKGYVVTKNSG